MKVKDIIKIVRERYPDKTTCISVDLWSHPGGGIYARYNAWTGDQTLSADSLEQLNALILVPAPNDSQETEKAAEEIEGSSNLVMETDSTTSPGE